MFEEHRVPAGTRLVHVGPPKTGTSAIQSALARVREQLPEHGVHYAGPGTRPREAVTELTRADAPEGELTAWDALSTEVDEAGDLTVCISNERFATASREVARKTVADLGGDRAHVVMVVRPLHAILPSQWQQRVRRSRGMISYDEWLRVVLGDQADNRHHGHFWVLHDLADQIDRWRSATAADRVTVIVSQEGDRGFLPRVFEGLLGLPEGLLVPTKEVNNRSFDRAEAELFRSLDRLADERGWSRSFYDEDLKRSISTHLRATLPSSPVPIVLPAWARDRVVELDAARRDLLGETDVRVVGDPAWLTAREPVVTTGEEPEVRVSLDSATAVAEALADRMVQREKALRRQHRQQQRAARRAAPKAPVGRGRRLLRRLRRR
jgi:hypothetical protein